MSRLKPTGSTTFRLLWTDGDPPHVEIKGVGASPMVADEVPSGASPHPLALSYHGCMAEIRKHRTSSNAISQAVEAAMTSRSSRGADGPDHETDELSVDGAQIPTRPTGPSAGSISVNWQGFLTTQPPAAGED